MEADGPDESSPSAEESSAAAKAHLKHLSPISMEITFPHTYPDKDAPGGT